MGKNIDEMEFIANCTLLIGNRSEGKMRRLIKPGTRFSIGPRGATKAQVEGWLKSNACRPADIPSHLAYDMSKSLPTGDPKEGDRFDKDRNDSFDRGIDEDLGEIREKQERLKAQGDEFAGSGRDPADNDPTPDGTPTVAIDLESGEVHDSREDSDGHNVDAQVS